MKKLTLVGLRFGAFVLVMAVLTGLLFAVFGDWRGGAASAYSAVFSDTSRLKAGDTVRAAGLRVGTVRDVELRPDGTVLVTFDADPVVVLTEASKVAVRYLNLVGDRYLELINAPGSTRMLYAGSQIPIDRTSPALDLDLLLGGLKPVIQGLNPQDVNALTASLLQVLQGQDVNLQSLFARGASFANTLAGSSRDIEQMITDLNTVATTIANNGERFTQAIDRLHRLVGELAQQRDTIGGAVDSLSRGTATIADLLTNVRPPLADTVNQLNALAPIIDDRKDSLEDALKRAPGNYRKLARLGSYGSWINYYICGFALRVSDLQGRTAVFPWIKQDWGRCADS
ncbi:MlaD family protein [Mycobacterium sp. OTB74]|jgi:phospholipid/cholesterol/gamma-HCH transport system substrate-binding protein|uniref:MlaD family protein n=1 Tax=Mycobacterium sp. OTB74 TaxID=1853452 RepID=UPI002473843E|nr:MlaD family protein [Mycobacterium sp. OTB74]MDH6246513.1 phospholipid/cholesterol/gamma-HCH transport system substrate-binding protein [Mycobacterium sp. OTB74]